jgi:hypothetical protein
VSLFVSCNDQAEVDALWARFLAAGATESRCGWLVDKFGLSWQIIPTRLLALIGDPDPEGAASRASDADHGQDRPRRDRARPRRLASATSSPSRRSARTKPFASFARRTRLGEAACLFGQRLSVTDS